MLLSGGIQKIGMERNEMKATEFIFGEGATVFTHFSSIIWMCDMELSSCFCPVPSSSNWFCMAVFNWASSDAFFRPSRCLYKSTRSNWPGRENIFLMSLIAPNFASESSSWSSIVWFCFVVFFFRFPMGKCFWADVGDENWCDHNNIGFVHSMGVINMLQHNNRQKMIWQLQCTHTHINNHAHKRICFWWFDSRIETSCSNPTAIVLSIFVWNYHTRPIQMRAIAGWLLIRLVSYVINKFHHFRQAEKSVVRERNWRWLFLPIALNILFIKKSIAKFKFFPLQKLNSHWIWNWTHFLFLLEMSSKNEPLTTNSIDDILEKYVPKPELTEINRILYGYHSDERWFKQIT